MPLVAYDPTEEEQRRLSELLDTDFKTAWDNVKRVWTETDCVYTDESSISYLPFENLLLQDFIERFPACEETLIQELGHPNPQIVGYCLLGLRFLQSPHLKNLPELMRTSVQEINWQFWCNSETGTLAEFIRQIALRPFARK